MRVTIPNVTSPKIVQDYLCLYCHHLYLPWPPTTSSDRAMKVTLLEVLHEGGGEHKNVFFYGYEKKAGSIGDI